MRVVGFVLIGLAVLAFLSIVGFFLGGAWTGDGRWYIMGAILIVPTFVLAALGAFFADEL